MIEHWIDAVQDVWATIQGDGFKYVRAPYMFTRADFPTAIDPSDLLSSPMALSITGEIQFKYSAGGPNEGFYQGITQFHVSPDLNMGHVPKLLKWPGLIAAKAAGNMKLGGLVHNFVLQNRPDQITGPVELQFGDETPHWGFIVYWEVKENLNTALTAATGE